MSLITDCNCSEVLIKTIEFNTVKRDSKLDVLRLVNRDNYEVFRNKHGSDSSFSVDLFSFGSNTTYEQFDKQRNKLYKKEKYIKENHEAIGNLRVGLEEYITDAWLECIKTCIQNSGFYAWIENFNEETVTVVLNWKPGLRDKDKIPIDNIQITGAKYDGDDEILQKTFFRKKYFLEKGEKRLTFIRDKNESFSCIINIKNESCGVYLPKYEPRIIKPNVKPYLLISITKKFREIWKDRGSGAKHDVAFYKPIASNNFSILGHYAQGNYGHPNGYVITVKVPEQFKSDGLVCQPKGYDQIWDDKKSGVKVDCAVWRPQPPPGYTCLGDVVTTSHTQSPKNDEIVCVRNDLVTSGRCGTWIWHDKGSGALRDITVYRVFAADPKIGVDLGLFQAYGRKVGQQPNFALDVLKREFTK